MITELFSTLEQISIKEQKGETNLDHVDLLITLKDQLADFKKERGITEAWVHNHDQYPKLLAQISKQGLLSTDDFDEIAQNIELDTCEVHSLFICAERESTSNPPYKIQGTSL